MIQALTIREKALFYKEITDV